MANIKYLEDPFTVSVAGQDLSFFYYGNYGGPDYPDKQELVTAKHHEPLSPEALLATDAPNPLSTIDYFFYVHDVESNSGKGYNKHQAEADLNLLTSLATNTASTDPEDLLYEGVATLAMVFQLATHNQIDAQSIPFVVGAVDQAIQEIQTGVAGLALTNPVELAAILSGVFGAPTGTAYELEFTFPNTGGTEIQQEFLEAMVTTAIGDVINEAGELAYVPPPVGTDDYLFRFDVATLDLDLLPIL